MSPTKSPLLFCLFPLSPSDCTLFLEISNGTIGGSSSSVMLASTSTFAAGQDSSSAQDSALTTIKASKQIENINLPASLTPSHHPPLIPSFPLKRKHEILHQNIHPPPKKAGQEVRELKTARLKPSNIEPLALPTGPQNKTNLVNKRIAVEEHKDQFAPKQTRQIQQRMMEEKCYELAVKVFRQTPSSVTRQPLKSKRAKCGPFRRINGPKMSCVEANGDEPHNQSKGSYLTPTLTTDPRVKDCGKLNPDEKMEMADKVGRAKVLVLTLVYQDGTTQLDPEQVSRAGWHI